MSTATGWHSKLTGLLFPQKRYNSGLLIRNYPYILIMWKNIFIESCLLSALIFGGFYIQSNIIRDEIILSNRSINESLSGKKIMHISGIDYPMLTLEKKHLSGAKSKFSTGHISGQEQILPTKKT